MVETAEDARVYLFVCAQWIKEVHAALEGAPSLRHLELHGFQACCGEPAVSCEEVRRRTAAIPGDAPAVWLGGDCLAALGDARSEVEAVAGELDRHVEIAHMRECVHMLEDPSWVEAQLKRGVHLCTPSWLDHWQALPPECDPRNPGVNGERLADAKTELVLLDTGRDAHAEIKLDALAERLERPVAT